MRRNLVLALATSLFVALLPLHPAEAVGGRTIYIDHFGTPSNSSSPAGTCETPNYAGSAGFNTALNTAEANDTIILCGGADSRYNLAGQITISVPLTIQGDYSTGTLPSIAVPVADTRAFVISTAGTVNFNHLLLFGGHAPINQNGGAILLTGGDLNLNEVHIFENSAKKGGALAITSGDGESDVLITRSVFSSNNADDAGGAIYVEGVNDVAIENSVFASNYANNSGGAIESNDSEHTLVNFSTFKINGNTLGNVLTNTNISNSILAESAGYEVCGENVVDGGGNLVTDSSCDWAAAWPTAVDVSALVTLGQLRLGELSTERIYNLPIVRLLEGSVAIDRVTDSLVFDIYQTDRPVGTRNDAGAYERPNDLNTRVLSANDGLRFSKSIYSMDELPGDKILTPTRKTYFIPMAGDFVVYVSYSPSVCQVDSNMGGLLVIGPGICEIASTKTADYGFKNGSTVWFEESMHVTTVEFKQFTEPSTPQNITVTPSRNGITVSWSAPTDNGGANLTYKVSAINSVSGGPFSVEKSNCNSPCVLSDVKEKIPYKIKITVSNGYKSAVYKPAGDPIYYRVAQPLPSKPLYVDAIAKKGGATVIWQRPETAGSKPITKYLIKVYLKSSPSKVYKTFTAKSTVSKFEVKGLPSKKSVIIKVFAVNGNGTSPASTAKTITVK